MNLNRLTLTKMKKLSLLLLLVIMILQQSCKKDDDVESYVRGGNSLIITPDEQMLIAGFNLTDQNSFDSYLAKVNGNGEVVWSNTYGDKGSDGFYRVINATGGGYVATGFITSVSNARSNLLVVKVSDEGSPEWSKVFGVDSIAQGFSLIATSDGGYVVCGYIMESYDDDRDIYLLKVNSSGERVWTKRYGKSSGSAAYDEAYDIAQASDGSLYITGSVAGNISCCGDAFLMKLSAEGDSLWSKTYQQGLGYSLAINEDGTIIIGGMVESNGQDLYLVKTTAAGELVWEKTYGGTGFDYGTTVRKTSDGGYAITGITALSGSSNQDIMLNKYDAAGALTWAKTFGGDDVDQGVGLIQHNDGGFSITGLSNSGGSNIFLNRIDNAGTETWQKHLK